MNKILIGPASFGEINLDAKIKLEKHGFKLFKNDYGRKLTTQELFNILNDREIVGVIAGLEEYSKEIISTSNLKVISRLGSGMDNIDLNEAKRNGVSVFSTPDGPTDSVAELVIGMMISLSRKVWNMNSEMKSGIWNRSYGNLIKDKQVTLVGYGRIGKQVHNLLQSFGCKINIVDPNIKDSDIANKMDLEKALAVSDIISFHIDKNIEIINKENINTVKKGCIILNSSRGNIISEECIIYGIKNKIISCAWLDVFKTEPYKGKLSGLPEIVLTPHIGSLTIDARLKMEKECAENIINFFNKSF